MKKLITLITVITVIAVPVNGQIIFDLADKRTKQETIDIDTDPIVIFKSLVNTKSGCRYTFEIEMHEQDLRPIPALSASENKFDPETSEFDLALQAFQDATDESAVSKCYLKLEEEIGKLDPIKYADKIKFGRAALQASMQTVTLGFKLRNNQEITITVTRYCPGGSKTDTTTWIRTFKTPEKSPWSIMYGFTYVPNLMNPVTNYYSAVDTAANNFTITPLHNQRNAFFRNISPTLMITWTPMQQYRFRGSKGKALFSNHFYQLGFTAGLSLNFASETGNVTALAAPSIVIARNVSLSAGVCMTQKQVLNGKYKEGDVIAENLDFDQLHEKQFMGEWFISLAIRFEKNPFEKKEADKKD